jgi:hypothetical protein
MQRSLRATLLVTLTVLAVALFAVPASAAKTSGIRALPYDGTQQVRVTYRSEVSLHMGAYAVAAWRYTPTENITVTLNTAGSVFSDTGSAFDTRLAIGYYGSDGGWIELAQNDDSYAPAGWTGEWSGMWSYLPSVTLSAGTTYYIEVGRYGSQNPMLKGDPAVVLIDALHLAVVA